MSEKPRPNSDAAARGIDDLGKFPTGSVPGMYLHVKKASKVWSLKYRLRGVEGTYTIGGFPDISYKRACELAQEARTWVAAGKKPLDEKNKRIEAELAQQGETFEKVARQWLGTKGDLASKTLLNYRATLDRHVLPALGAKPVHEVTWRHISRLLVDLGSRPTAAAHARVTIKQILEYALDLGAVDENVALGRGKKLTHTRKTRHHPALETADELREYFGRVMDMAPPDKPATWALWLLPLLAVRPSELCAMKWEDVDFDLAQWRFTPSKTGRPLIVPLADQVIGQLNLIKERRGMVGSAPRPFGFGSGLSKQLEANGFVFASDRSSSKHISPTTLLLAIRALGYSEDELTAHGFRTTFRTLARGKLRIDRDVLELSLGHKMPGPLGSTYAREDLIEERTEAMQQWASFIENLCWEASYGVSKTDAENALVDR